MTRLAAMVGIGAALVSGSSAVAAWAQGATGAATAQPPRQVGVVFFLPPTGEEAVRQLEAVQADGFNMVKLASWVWTVPTEGSDLRRTVQMVLDWCDAHGMAVWLLHNIQWGSPGEGGDPETALDRVSDKARDTLAPWMDVMRGHPCVSGVLLGNEVGPGGRELFKDRPRLLGAFRDWLAARHGSIGALNARWGTQYASFDEVGLPGEEAAKAEGAAADGALPALPPGALVAGAGPGGEMDLTRFCRAQFARFYDRIAAEVVFPVLPGAYVGSKGGASPYILGQMPHYNVCSWDDLLARWPLWKIKLLVDTTGLPVFNSELHLYHDVFEFGPAAAISRYRYFTSALLGEWMTASFAWGQWEKPQIAAIHQGTPAILQDLARLEPALRAFNGRSPAFEVLVTEGNEEGVEGHPRLEEGYACAATTGLDWRFVADRRLDGERAPVLVVDAPWLTRETARGLTGLPNSVQVVCVGEVPDKDEYGLTLPEGELGALRARATVIGGWEELGTVVTAVPLPSAYREVVDVPYLWWSPEKGHFEMPVRYPKLEARAGEAGGRRYVAIINHTDETVREALPLALGEGRWVDLATEEEAAGEVEVGGYGVKVFGVSPRLP